MQDFLKLTIKAFLLGCFVAYVILLISCTPTKPIDSNIDLDGVYIYEGKGSIITYDFSNETYKTSSSYEGANLTGWGKYTLENNILCLNLKEYCIENECDKSSVGKVCQEITKTKNTLVFYGKGNSKTVFKRVMNKKQNRQVAFL